MTPLHHPADDILMAYAAGNLGEASSLVVASHLALCPACRAEVRQMEAVGGALLDDMPEADLSDDLLAHVMAAIERPMDDGDVALATRPSVSTTRPVLPEPLRGYLGGDLSDVRWTRLLRGLEEAEIPMGAVGSKGRLLRIKGGTAMPRHTHEGVELTLVLSGAFSDNTGRYARGDFAATDQEIDHKPVAEMGQDCICLIVTDAPLKLTGTFGRLLNPFIRF